MVHLCSKSHNSRSILSQAKALSFLRVKITKAGTIGYLTFMIGYLVKLDTMHHSSKFQLNSTSILQFKGRKLFKIDEKFP